MRPPPPAELTVKGAKPAALPSFIEPALASLVEKPPTGDRWVHEVKFDGYRLLARLDHGRVKLLTRSGLDWTSKFANVAKALAALPVVTAFLDGEVVVETDHGVPDFGALQADLSEGRSDRFSYYLFDLLYLDGKDMRASALLDRKAALRTLLADATDGVLKYSEHFTDRGDLVLKHAARLGLEGIVSKVANAPYRSGRSKAWLKIKSHRERGVRGYRLRALHDAAPHRRLALACHQHQGQAHLRGPGRLGVLGGDCRRSLGAPGEDPNQCAGAGGAPAGRSSQKRALGEAVAGGRSGVPQLDGGQRDTPCRLQGVAAGQGRRPRSCARDRP